jgi:protein-S-isoprenylcysteine O-methyltransferase Ste14
VPGAARLRQLASGGIGAIFWLLFAYANIEASLKSNRIIGAGVGILGLWVAVLFIARRAPDRVSRSVPAWVVAFLGSFGASALRPGGPHTGSLDHIGLALQGLSLIMGAVALRSLGRSLGLVPANRGVVTSGAYRVVRHPLYTSYIVADFGYLVQSPRFWNAGVLLAVWTCQILRILSEERLLSNDPEYRAYSARTRRRLIPGVW